MNLKTRFVDGGSQAYYRPFATRTLVLVSLLLITLTLIAITEYACRTIPNHSGIGAIGNIANDTLKRDLVADVTLGHAQLVQRLENFNPILSLNPLSLYSITSSSSSSSSSSPSPTSTVIGGYLSLGGGSSSAGGNGGVHIIPSIVHGGWLSTGDGSTTDPNPPATPVSQPSTVNNPASNSASQPTPPPVVGGNDLPGDPTTAGGAAPSVMPVNPVQQPTSIATPDYGGPAGTNAPGGPNAVPTSVIIVSNSQTLVETPKPTSVIVTSDSKVFSETVNLGPTAVIFTSDGKTFTQSLGVDVSLMPIVVVSDGKTFTETPSLPASVQAADPTSVVYVSDGKTHTSTPSPDNQSNPTPVIVVSDGRTFTETPSYAPPGAASTTSESAIKPVATIVNSTGTFLLWPGGDSSIYPQITLLQYILVAFVPLILAVLYTVPFRILDRTIREFEPFYQLSQSGGALAEHSFCLDYTTSNAFITPFKAGLRGHSYMFWSSLVSLAVAGLAPLSSEALFVSLSGGPGLYGANVEVHYQDYASWGIYPALARMIEGLLAFVAILIVFMIWYGTKRESGVYGEPLSIAGLATLFHSSPLLRGFRAVDSQVSNSELKKILAGQRYKIGEFMTADYRPGYGLLPADSESGFILNAYRSRRGPYRLVEGSESAVDLVESASPTSSSKQKKMSQVWERTSERLLYIGILILNTGMLTLISYYHWSEGDIHHGFERFMDSSNFGVRFMMTVLGVVLKMFWSNLDQELRRVAPYNRLALSSASPLDSLLVPTYMSPFSAIIPSLRQKHFLIANIAFLSILSELLPIFLANVTYSAATTQPAYEACNDISLAILILMLISMFVLILKPTKGVKRLPRNPDTVASVLVYLAGQSGVRKREGLLASMKGLETVNTEERNETISGWGRTYSLGLDKSGELKVDEDGQIERLWVE